MSYEVELQGYRPGPRYAEGAVPASPWTDVDFEVSSNPSGPWSIAESQALVPLDANPAQPSLRNFTFQTVLSSGYVRVVFVAGAVRQITNPVRFPVSLTAPGARGALPNIEGFRAAQQFLRDELGTEVPFHTPIAPAWPPGTKLDPQTQRPFDPTIEPISGGGYTTVTVKVSMVARVIRTNVEDPLGGDVSGGLRRGESIAMGISVADYPAVQNATAATVAGIEYKLTDIIRDPGLDNRYIAFGEAK